MTFTDTQLVLLSAAAQRNDHLIALPDRLKGGAAKAVVSRLLAHGLVEEVAIGRDDPNWRTDEANGSFVGLKLTTDGLQAIGIEPDGQGAAPPSSPSENNTSPAPAARPKACSGREGLKRTQVIALLSRDAGATLDDLVQATGWLPHTTRAALTGLRQRGYSLSRTKDGNGRSVYCIASTPQQASPDAPAAEA